jgi:hypothetical protein
MTLDVYIEVGTKRVFAGAIDWPGWCRGARTEDDAVAALAAYARRYGRVVARRRLGFAPPSSASELSIVDRLRGDGTTDFGAPSIAPRADARPINEADLARVRTILDASWTALDRVVEAARGVKLASGPRGGGRALGAIVEHVLGADAAYLRKIAGSPPPIDGKDLEGSAARLRDAILEALTSAVHHGLPAKGPRGGRLWKPRYFVRRSAWHVLDHAWEIEDRSADR